MFCLSFAFDRNDVLTMSTGCISSPHRGKYTSSLSDRMEMAPTTAVVFLFSAAMWLLPRRGILSGIRRAPSNNYICNNYGLNITPLYWNLDARPWAIVRTPNLNMATKPAGQTSFTREMGMGQYLRQHNYLWVFGRAMCI